MRLSAADTFGLQGFNQVYTGEYTVKGGTATAFAAHRDTPAQADADARRYREFLSANGYRKLDSPAPPAGMELFALDDSFEIILVQGRAVAGVHDAPSPEAALALADKLRTALKGKP